MKEFRSLIGEYTKTKSQPERERDSEKIAEIKESISFLNSLIGVYIQKGLHEDATRIRRKVDKLMSRMRKILRKKEVPQ